jgi:hypothetical protein
LPSVPALFRRNADQESRLDRAFLFRALIALAAMTPAATLWGQVSTAIFVPTESPKPVSPLASPPSEAEPHPLVRTIELEAAKPLPVDAGEPAIEPAFEPNCGTPAMMLLGPPGSVPCQWFHRPQWSVQYITGVLFTPYHFGIPMGGQIHMNFLMENVRFNRVLRGYDPTRLLLRGSTELVIEVHTMPIVKGPGNIVIGAGFYARYNFGFTKLNRWVLYTQAGGGAVYSDSYQHPRTNMVSGANFIIHLAGGTHYFLTPRLSLDTEAAYYHYSNGGIVLPNVSINGANAFFGMTYYFGRRCR